MELASEAKAPPPASNRFRLEITELANDRQRIKFLSDMFLARVYQLGIVESGRERYRRIVDDNRGIALQFLRFMVGRVSRRPNFCFGAQWSYHSCH